MPGPIGAFTERAVGLSPRPSRSHNPIGSSIDTGRSCAPTAEMPMLAGSARVRNTSPTVSMSHTALAPTNISFETAASINAISAGSSSTRTSSRLQRVIAASKPSSPAATDPAAIPASVPSTICGNTLFVPVEIGTIGTSPAPLATTRFVPSPPSVTMHPAPSEAIIRAASVEPSWWSTRGMSR